MEQEPVIRLGDPIPNVPHIWADPTEREIHHLAAQLHQVCVDHWKSQDQAHNHMRTYHGVEAHYEIARSKLAVSDGG